MSRLSPLIHRFTVAEYERMEARNVLRGRRVELIEGRILKMPAQLTPHMTALSKSYIALLKVALPSEWLIQQGTLRLDRYSAPEPDLMLLPVPLGTPHSQWPLPLLVIEASDTTYHKDAGIKLRKYAQAGITDYWIENLPEDRIEVYRDPQNPTGKLKACRYASVTHFARGQSVALLARPEVVLAVDDLLP